MTAYTLAANALAKTSPRDKHKFGPEKAIPMCIYAIAHKDSGRVYVGQTVKAARYRWSNHLYKDGERNSLIKRALRKYGRGAFDFSVIDIAETLEQLNHKEEFWINQYMSVTPNGFNLMSGGGGRGLHSEETKEKIRAAKIAQFPEGFIHTGINALRRMKTPEEKAASIAAGNESRRGKPTWLSLNGLTPEQREKARLAKIGKPVPKKWKRVVRSDGVEFESVNAAAAALSCDRRLVGQALSGRRPTAKGFGFTFKEI